jgi:ribosome-associated heat shock protein Hsp15
VSTDDPEDGALGWQRLDRWLWCARFIKTRTAATRLAEQGRIRINRQRTEKAHARVRPGDVLTVGMGPSIRVVRVLALGHRRGPAEEARRLYEDLEPSLG